MSHLGNRVSALLDGRLSPDVEERLWAHVHTCHPCRDLVEREGWVKTRLAAWSLGGSRETGPVPEALKSSLLDPAVTSTAPWLEECPARGRGLLLAGGGVAGAVGVTMVGVLALGAAPADAPSVDRRGPVTELTRPTTVSWADPPRGLRAGTRTPRAERSEGPRATMGR